jgi:predicted exporter
MLSAVGGGCIVLLLLASLRSVSRTTILVAPLAAAVILTMTSLTLGGHQLSIFNLFGLLLVVAVGSNYCLFFDRQKLGQGERERTLASLVLANLCTVIGFGVLSFSRIPVLHDLGMPVAIGTFLSLLFSAILMTPSAFTDTAAQSAGVGTPRSPHGEA